MHMWGPGFNYYGGGDWLMGILVLLIVGYLVYIVARNDLSISVAGRRETGSTALGSSESQAIKILKERYARGEIDRQEYMSKIEDLR